MERKGLKMANIINGLLTNKELAELLNVSTKTLQRYRKEGMPYLRLSYSAIRYDHDKAMAWINKRYEQKDQDRA